MRSHLLPVIEFRILDANAEELGVSRGTLMDHAGKAVADFVRKNSGGRKKVAVYCGLGNNGGDGFVAASYLRGDFDVRVITETTHKQDEMLTSRRKNVED
ncbi:MAG: NAD(P)H-hydrate epimerase, partial [Methanomassiliicoccales archaeon]